MHKPGQIRERMIFWTQSSPKVFRVGLVAFPVVFLLVSVIGVAWWNWETFKRTFQVVEVQTVQDYAQQVETSMQSVLSLSARQVEDQLGLIESQLAAISGYLKEVYRKRETLRIEEYWRSEDHLERTSGGHYVGRGDEASGVFLPADISLDAAVRRDLAYSAYIELIAPGVLAGDPHFKTVFYATPRNVLRYYPNSKPSIDLAQTERATASDWYRGGLRAWQEGRIYLSQPHRGWDGLGTVITASMPVFSDAGTLLGVVAIEFEFDGIARFLSAPQPEGYVFLLDENGNAIFLPERGYSDFSVQPLEGESPNLLSARAEMAQLVQEMRAGARGFSGVNLDDRQLWVVYMPVADARWSLGYVVDASVIPPSVAEPAQDFSLSYWQGFIGKVLPFTLLMVLVLIGVGILLVNRIFEPIAALTRVAQQLAAHQWEVNVPDKAPGEVGLLASAFDRMRNELVSLYANLEERVAERTRSLARKNVQLQTAAEVAREVIGTRDFKALLNRAVNLLADRFGYPYVGLFLVDPQGEFAVLQAASGEAGRAMLEQAHRLRVGSTSAVGYAASTGEPRLIQSAVGDPYYLVNPLLPDTRSELVLPLIVNRRIIGVLDVHSSEEAGFTQEDKDVLQTLADQLAIAIDNSRLYQAYRDLEQQFESLQRQVSQQIWTNTSHSMRLSAYQYDASGLRPILRNELERDTEAAPLTLPIQVRSETVAYLDIWPSGEGLTPSERKLLDLLRDRLSQAFESARLFDEAQRRAARERAVNEFVANLSTSLDLDGLMQSALKQFRALPGIAEVEIRIDPVGSSTDSQDDNGHESDD